MLHVTTARYLTDVLLYVHYSIYSIKPSDTVLIELASLVITLMWIFFFW